MESKPSKKSDDKKKSSKPKTVPKEKKTKTPKAKKQVKAKIVKKGGSHCPNKQCPSNLPSTSSNYKATDYHCSRTENKSLCRCSTCNYCQSSVWNSAKGRYNSHECRENLTVNSKG